MLTIYDESILQELDDMGYSIAEYTDKYLYLRAKKEYILLQDIESVEKLLGVEFVQIIRYITLWRKEK